MIHRISKNLLDEDALSKNLQFNGNAKKEGPDFSEVIVKKPWGYEYLVFENEFVAIWILQLVRKKKTSMHCHPKKRTGLILLSGQATFRHLEGELELKEWDGVDIERGVFHSTEAFSDLMVSPVSENGIWVMEIESPPQKDDLVRLEDEYGRAGASYEGIDNMVFEPKECLKLKTPPDGETFSKDFLNINFRVQKGPIENISRYPNNNALVSIIGQNSQKLSDNHFLRIGGVTNFGEFNENTKNEDLSNFTMLIIEQEPATQKLSDYVASFVSKLGITDVFSVSGGGAMHLVDSVGKHEKIAYVAMHHEQAASYAAEGYARISGKPGVALVTTGPGGTNAISGVYGAWIDSIPTIFLAGQVPRNQMINDTGLRQYGVQESDMVTLVKPITKYAVVVDDPAMIRFHMEKALHMATSGRPGPVWLDIPLDVQSQLIEPNKLDSFQPDAINLKELNAPSDSQISQCLQMLKKAKRPVLMSGYGIRLAKGENEFIELVDKLNIPVVCSWTSSDLIPYDDDNFVGRCGIFGDRAGNFSVQNADLILVIGSRLSVPQSGYNPKAFAREAQKIIVDIDLAELGKPSFDARLPIQADARVFMRTLLDQIDQKGERNLDIDDWREKCQGWKKKYPVVLPEYKEEKKFVNSFYFVDVLASKMDESAVICTDMGTSFTCTMQTFQIKKGQRLFTSSGHAPMGFGLPGAIGACFANGRKKTICISGDGGLQMNIQELQTLAHYQLPIILFVLNNGGYLTIKLMQQNHFGRYVGAEKSSGVSCPDIIKVGQAYGIGTERINNHAELDAKINSVLEQKGPFICEIMMSDTQPLIPRVSSIKKPDGSIVSQPLENLFPFLAKKEFEDNMIVKPLEGLNQ
jgi:acetolactate synthase I/II/III large subunit